MREIKLRAWDESQKYMAYQGEPDNETLSSFMHHWSDYILMQYTGLKDKNGKEIYEGDKNQDGGIVIWVQDDASFCWEYPNKDIMPMEYESDWCEIIGNIYENQNLITK